jgi:hypothetical protein
MKHNKKNIRGLSLAEVLVATTIASLIFAAAYLMYDYFQSSFTTQLRLSDLQGEARVAVLNLDLDTKKAGYSLPNTLPVKKPVLISTNTVSFCYDEKTIRKRVIYSLNTTNKNITRSVYEIDTNSVFNEFNNCNPDDTITTNIIPTVTTVANKVNSFSATLQGNVIIVNIGLQSENGVEETYNERFFLKNYDRCPPVAITSGLIVNFDACDERNNNQTDRWVNKGTGGSNYDAAVNGNRNYTSNGQSSYFSTRRNHPIDPIIASDFFIFPPAASRDMSWAMWFRSQDTAINQGHLWWANAMIIGHEMNSTPNDWGITMGGGKICWGTGNYSSPFSNDLDGTTDQAFCTVNSNYNNGNWTYLVVTRTNGDENSINSEVKIYINGNQVSAFVLPFYIDGVAVENSTAINSGTRNRTGEIGIGASHPDGTLSTGWNADVAIVHGYNRVLTQAEISTNYNAQRMRFGL